MSTLLRSRQEKPVIGVTCKISNDFSEDILIDQLTLTGTKQIKSELHGYNVFVQLFSSDRAFLETQQSHFEFAC